MWVTKIGTRVHPYRPPYMTAEHHRFSGISRIFHGLLILAAAVPGWSAPAPPDWLLVDASDEPGFCVASWPSVAEADGYQIYLQIGAADVEGDSGPRAGPGPVGLRRTTGRGDPGQDRRFVSGDVLLRGGHRPGRGRIGHHLAGTASFAAFFGPRRPRIRSGLRNTEKKKAW